MAQHNNVKLEIGEPRTLIFTKDHPYKSGKSQYGPWWAWEVIDEEGVKGTMFANDQNSNQKMTQMVEPNGQYIVNKCSYSEFEISPAGTKSGSGKVGNSLPSIPKQTKTAPSYNTGEEDEFKRRCYASAGNILCAYIPTTPAVMAEEEMTAFLDKIAMHMYRACTSGNDVEEPTNEPEEAENEVDNSSDIPSEGVESAPEIDHSDPMSILMKTWSWLSMQERDYNVLETEMSDAVKNYNGKEFAVRFASCSEDGVESALKELDRKELWAIVNAYK